LSNLDALLRERVRHELKELFTKVHATVVYVTHDQIEALTLADRIVVLDKGRIQQIGTPEEVYRSPANRFVASFIGSPSMSLFEASLEDGRFSLDSETIDTGLEFSGLADVGIRPEAIRLEGQIQADVTWVENLGLNALVGLRAGDVSLTALAAQRPSGRSIRISFDPREIHVFEKKSGANVARTAGHRSIRS
jgi:ABC-type sugar transport system ATPase subunit